MHLSQMRSKRPLRAVSSRVCGGLTDGEETAEGDADWCVATNKYMVRDTLLITTTVTEIRWILEPIVMGSVVTPLAAGRSAAIAGDETTKAGGASMEPITG